MIHPLRLPFTIAALLRLTGNSPSPTLDAPAGTGGLPLFSISGPGGALASTARVPAPPR